MVDRQPLTSWNDGAAKSAILDLVARVTKTGGAEFVPPAARVATFDNDGTLWCEQPLQIQFFFAFDRVKQLASKDPTLCERQPFKAVLEHDYSTLFGLGKQALFELAFATHAGVTDEDFVQAATEWLATARHPKFDRLYKECAYRPQVELLAYLRENGFKTYIVSAGGVDFMRAFADEAYGIPREQVIGSSVKLRYDLIDGNSDGDLAMMRYTKSGSGARLALLLHHDDAEREAAYDREFRLSPLSEALDKAQDYGITVVSMKKDWKIVF